MNKIYVGFNPDYSRISVTMWPKDFTSLEDMALKVAECLNAIVFKEANVQLIAIPKELPRVE